MNYWKQIAAMLGVELEEEFKVGGYDSDFVITENGFWFADDGVKANNNSLLILRELLNGDCEIIKKPWIPKIGEPYYTIHNEYSYNTACFRGDNIDLAWLKCGWIFRTQEEAEANCDRILAEHEKIKNGEF